MSLPDQQSVESCLDGHPEAYRQLVERYQAPLMRCLWVQLGNQEEVAEAAQETFVRAYFALSNLRKPEAFFSWLVGIAQRVAQEARRAAKRRRQFDQEQFELAKTTDKRPTDADPAVAEAVAQLPDTCRQVVLLRFYGGLSCQEISRDLNVPLGTVTKRLSRAYGLLRERLRACIPARENEAPR
jgi:RNA polymerase sigma-70 factor, ECF subfamily